jgi:inhibitor of cysteine peptidase
MAIGSTIARDDFNGPLPYPSLSTKTESKVTYMDNKKLAIIGALVVLALVAGALLGYILKETPAANAATDQNAVSAWRVGDHIYTMSSNGTPVDLKKGTTFLVALPENGGSTGYLWDITSMQGLDVLESWFVTGSQGLIGEPGTREWVIRAAWPGEQKFKATLKRSFEAATGDETTFVLTVNVVA